MRLAEKLDWKGLTTQTPSFFSFPLSSSTLIYLLFSSIPVLSLYIYTSHSDGDKGWNPLAHPFIIEEFWSI